MNVRSMPAPPLGNSPHLILFDGECSFCAGWVRFVLAHDPHGTFHFAALQSDVGRQRLAQLGRSSSDLNTVYVVTSYTSANAACLTRSDAAAFIASQLGGAWPFAGALVRLAPRRLRDAGYDLVARFRHRLGDTSTTCVLPTPEQRPRFLDQPHGAND